MIDKSRANFRKSDFLIGSPTSIYLMFTENNEGRAANAVPYSQRPAKSLNESSFPGTKVALQRNRGCCSMFEVRGSEQFLRQFRSQFLGLGFGLTNHLYQSAVTGHFQSEVPISRRGNHPAGGSAVQKTNLH